MSDDFMKAPLTPSGLQRSPSKVLSALERSHAWNRNAGEKKDAGRLAARTKSTEEKQAMLGRYLTNVEELVRDLRENAPFGLLAT